MFTCRRQENAIVSHHIHRTWEGFLEVPCNKGSQRHRVVLLRPSQSDAGNDGEDDALGEILEARLHLRVAEEPSSASASGVVVGHGGRVCPGEDCLI